jgi:uncharacterized RDD family membrane protein YckC
VSRLAPHGSERRAEPVVASLARRLGALLYEALLACAMALVAGFAFLPFASPLASSALTLPPPFVRTLMFCALAGGAGVYCAWSWSDGRRTLPQKTWRIRVVDRDGHAPTRRRALARYVAAWIGPAAALVAYALLRSTGHAGAAGALVALNYAWALVDADRQFLHDRLAGTRVVRDR